MNNFNNYRAQRFREAWLQEYPGWLRPVANDEFRAYCQACQIFMNAHKTTIDNHFRSERHAQIVFELDGVVINERAEELKVKVARAEMKICAVFAEHNLAFLLADDLIPVIKEISADRDARLIWERIRLDRKRVKAIIQHCIAAGHKNEVAESLRNARSFTIFFDESTNTAHNQQGCVIVKYPDFNKRKMITSLWEIFPTRDDYLDIHDANAERLCDIIRRSFQEENVPTDYISAFCSDGASTMMGDNSGVARRFQIDNPNIVIVKCPSHILHLCAQNSIIEFPINIEKFCSDLNKYFCHSAKRNHVLIEFEAELNADINKILRQASTRWLSLEACIKRILELYDVLIAYFRHEVNVNRIPAAEPIRDFLENESNKCYLHFLSFILSEVNKVNKFFQKKDVILHKIKGKLHNLFKIVAGCFMSQNYVDTNEPENINVFDNGHYKLILDVNLGNDANQLVNNLGLNERLTVKTNCFNFLQDLTLQMKIRFNNFQNNYYENLSALSPTNAISPRYHENNMDIMENITQQFRHFIPNQNDINTIVDEWHNLIFLNLPEEIRNVNIHISDFWFELYFHQDGLG